mgnify:CR=1 FL=1|tara:strand:- start:898 stop:1554 length:657 start_codon:yes stop_codon:yes gene_type:complete
MKEKIIFKKKWDYENGFYLTSDKSRLQKIITHYEIFKKTRKVRGDIIEFGVFKGNSLIRFATYRDIFKSNKKIIGFDAFGRFPIQNNKNDNKFIKKFEKESGIGISLNNLKSFLNKKKLKNILLYKGNIETTIEEFLKENKLLKISFLHIDVDVYQPTKIILEKLFDKVSRNGIILFDDYSVIEGETKAVDEFLKKKNIKNKLKRIPYTKGPYYLVKS